MDYRNELQVQSHTLTPGNDVGFLRVHKPWDISTARGSECLHRVWRKTCCDTYSENVNANVLSTLSYLVLSLLNLCLCFRSILEKEGPRSLFRGLGPNLVGVAPSRYSEIHPACQCCSAIQSPNMSLHFWVAKSSRYVAINGNNARKHKVSSWPKTINKAKAKWAESGWSLCHWALTSGSIENTSVCFYHLMVEGIQ